jgi:hypothetical protein
VVEPPDILRSRHEHASRLCFCAGVVLSNLIRIRYIKEARGSVIRGSDPVLEEKTTKNNFKYV